MAVAAYAALLSLSHVLENVQHPSRQHRLHLNTRQIQSLQEKVVFLQEFFELHSQRISQEMADLARQITVTADEAEDIIDFHVVYQLGEGSQDHESDCMTALSSFCQDIDKLIETIDFLRKGLMKIKEEWGDVAEHNRVVCLPSASSSTLPPSGGKMVGLEEHVVRVMDELTGHRSDLHILPIVGMGGIGKTTLARNVFDNPYIVHHFDKRVWLTISQEYSAEEILVRLFNDGKSQESSDFS
ncbi:UNVERIFIED_CONTAM: putative disease resistance protein [Sesamum latifolium]|uniref:Disease resistance protein n=1 Tax=Sesamum latifolium TaxID=2727402 RepID=A0AAW2UIT2_9LAMI